MYIFIFRYRHSNIGRKSRRENGKTLSESEEISRRAKNCWKINNTNAERRTFDISLISFFWTTDPSQMYLFRLLFSRKCFESKLTLYYGFEVHYFVTFKSIENCILNYLFNKNQIKKVDVQSFRSKEILQPLQSSFKTYPT